LLHFKMAKESQTEKHLLRIINEKLWAGVRYQSRQDKDEFNTWKTLANPSYKKCFSFFFCSTHSKWYKITFFCQLFLQRMMYRKFKVFFRQQGTAKMATHCCSSQWEALIFILSLSLILRATLTLTDFDRCTTQTSTYS
jgi:hypothetical protein